MNKEVSASDWLVDRSSLVVKFFLFAGVLYNKEDQSN